MLVNQYNTQTKTTVELYEIDTVKKFNQQIVNNIEEKIEAVQYELVNLSDLLIKHGDLLKEKF